MFGKHIIRWLKNILRIKSKYIGDCYIYDHGKYSQNFSKSYYCHYISKYSSLFEVENYYITLITSNVFNWYEYMYE